MFLGGPIPQLISLGHPNTTNNTVRGNSLGANKSGTRRLPIRAFERIADQLGNDALTLTNRTKDNIVENNIIAGTRSGGIGAINSGATANVEGGSSNIIRNNRIGIGPNGENIAPDPTEPENARAVGIAASAGDQVTGNIIANFGSSGISLRTLAPPVTGSPFPPAVVSNNQISNCGVGIQAVQVGAATISENRISNCSKGGIVVGERIFDASTGTRFEVTDPFGVATRNISLSRNRFENVSGPGIALTSEVANVFINNYRPNTLTERAPNGPNLFQPSPVLTSALRNQDGSVTVTGRTGDGGKLELYQSSRPAQPTAPDTEINAYGLGTFLTSADVSGGQFTVTIPAGMVSGLTALTATITVGDQTSEFARTVEVQGSQPEPDTVPPTVSVTAPASGQTIESKAGTQLAIVWQSSDNVAVVRHDIRLTGLAGTVQTIATGLDGSTKNFTWNVPETLNLPRVQVVVEARDAANNIGQGISGTFSILPPTPPDTEKPVVSSVTLSAKKVKRKVDPTLTITWKSTDNIGVVSHDLLFADTTPVVSGLPGSTQTFTWTVPASI
ncbi:MAG: right-handed parallel beta-helix repeat-containing protein, partial [Blastocatellia bacterium]|nr:right-handed parallel beta-helix repeat-containing protein [Blastocatellia bacterium]